jgi:carbamoyltransferase
LAVAIGLTFPAPHDTSAAAIVDGRLVFATEEERHTRHKHSRGEPPINSVVQTLRYLSRLGIKPDGVDIFAINWDPNLLPLRVRRSWGIALVNRYLAAGYLEDLKSLTIDFAKWTYHSFNFVEIAKFILKKAYRQIGSPFPVDAKIIPVMHHLTHAAAAYYFSGFSSSSVLSIDGGGERDATTIWKVKDGEFERIASIEVGDGSVGLLYDSVSERLGFDIFEGPGKVMGLAPYGKNEEKISSKFGQVFKVFDNGDIPYRLSDTFRKSRVIWTVDRDRMYGQIADYLTEGLDLSWSPTKQLSEPVSNVAWSLQHLVESTMEATAKWTKVQTGENKICLAGGVALNAKANMNLYYSKMFGDMFVFPCANDAGCSVGAAAYAYEHFIGEKMKHGKLTDVCFGPEYDDQVVKDIVNKGKWNSEYIGGDVSQVANLVSKGKVIAWYQGRAELGPRALGSRSIVADPTKKETWKMLNAIKGREFWRPLAPSVLDEDKEDYFRQPTDHRFMILMFKMTEEGAKRAPAVCHVDMTARPQTVTRENERWYELIKSFKDLTGEGIIVNTSFNLAGEPMVETPREAIVSFALGGFDALYLQGWLVRKNP